jgi:hypothetical protein
MEDQYRKTEKAGFKAWLRTDDFVLLTIVAILIPLMVHTANVLLQISMVKNIYYAYFFAFAFDLAIFVHALNGQLRAAAGLAFIVFLLNVAYFNLDTFNNHANPEVVKFCISTILAGASAYLVHSYVEMFYYKQEKENDDRKLWEQIKGLKGTIEEQKQIVATSKDAELKIVALEKDIEYSKAIIEELESRLQQSTSNTAVERDTFMEAITEMVNGTNRVDQVAQVEVESIKKFSCDGCGRTVTTEKSFNQMITYCPKKNCEHKTVSVDKADAAMKLSIN